MQPLVVVSIVNWNTPEQTLACLDSLRKLTYENMRVIVVDNGSQDDSVTTIPGRTPEIKLIISPENLGFAGGHTLALQQAQLWDADAIWLVNSDAFVENDALTRLVDAWKHHGDALYGGAPLQRRKDGSVLFDFPAKFLPPESVPEAWQRDHEMIYDDKWRDRCPMRVGALAGSTFFVPLNLVARYGWLDPVWFMYCEETDYCYRLRKQGVPRYLVPMSRVWHAAGGSHRGRARVTDVIQYYHARNEILLAQHHGKRGSASVIAIKKALRGLANLPTNRTRAGYILRGALDGLRGFTGKRFSPEDFL
ncbi:MAG: glycosyltransferase family 2 protein [Dokdonella sp.]